MSEVRRRTRAPIRYYLHEGESKPKRYFPQFPILNLFLQYGLPRPLAGQCINYIRQGEKDFKLEYPVFGTEHTSYTIQHYIEDPVDMFHAFDPTQPPRQVKTERIHLHFYQCASILIRQPRHGGAYERFYFSYAFDHFVQGGRDYSTLYICTSKTGWEKIGGMDYPHEPSSHPNSFTNPTTY